MRVKSSLSGVMFVAAVSLALVGCDSGPDQSSATERALEELQAGYEKLTDFDGREAVKWAKEDLKNIGDWEYRIVDVAMHSPDALEAKLNDLGNERWEAFWVDSSGDSLRILLKRPSISYISKVPFSQLGRMIPGDGDGQE